MSKSLGNSLTIRDALEMYNYEVIKYVMFSKHYTSDIDLLDGDFLLAQKHLYYFYNTIKEAQKFIELYNGTVDGDIMDDEIPKNIISKFIEVMDDDFNTAAAVSELYGIFKYMNYLITSANKSNRVLIGNTLAKIMLDLKEVYGTVLGLLEQSPDVFISEVKGNYLKKLDLSEEFINSQITKRAESKKVKDFETADFIRGELEKKGIILKDLVHGTTWDVSLDL